MSNGVIQIASLAAGFLGIVLILLAFQFEHQAKKSTILRRTRVKGKKVGGSSFDWLYRLPILGRFAVKTRMQLFLTGVADDGLNRKSAVLSLIAIGLTGGVYLLLAQAYRMEAFSLLALILLLIGLPGILVRMLAGNADVRILSALLDYLGDVKHQYHAIGMVDEAIRRANLRADKDMLVQGLRIQDILAAAHPEAALRLYTSRCPVRFLRLFASFSLLVREYGDRTQDGSSLYIRNLNHIMEEIQMEMVKQNQLTYWLRGLNLIALLPLLFPPIIRNWITVSFPVVAAFYNSKEAFFILCLLFLLIFLSNLFIREIQKSEYRETADGLLQKHSWLNQSVLKPLGKWIAPKSSSSRYRRIAEQLSNAGSATTVEAYSIQRILTGALVFACTLAIVLHGHQVASRSILADEWFGMTDAPFQVMTGSATEEIAAGVSIKDADTAVVQAWVHQMGHLTEEEIQSKVASTYAAYGLADEKLAVAIKRALDKMSAIASETVRGRDFLFPLFLGWLGTFVPGLLLLFRRVIRKIDMEQEVYQFHTIILLLMHHESVDVKVVLTWMRDFAVVFREPLELCLSGLQHTKIALERLRAGTPYKPFVKIVENLMMASEDIDMKTAFDSLEMERNFYRENRKEMNRQQVSRKVSWGQMIGFVPIYAVILLYLVVPMVVSSFQAFSLINEQLK